MIGYSVIPNKLISSEYIIKFLKEITNVDVKKEKIMQMYKGYYNEKLNAFVFAVSDSIYCEYNIASSYKIGSKYYLTLQDGKVVTLIKENSNYYFYSCDGKN